MKRSLEYVQWNLPEGAKARLGKGYVTDIAYSPDGETMAAASSAGVWLYDAKTGAEMGLLGVPGELAYAVAFSPNGKRIAAANADGKTRIWNVQTADQLASLMEDDDALCAAFSPDGRTLATGGLSDLVHLWDVSYGQLITALKGHRGSVRICRLFAGRQAARQLQRSRLDNTHLGRAAVQPWKRVDQNAQRTPAGCEKRRVLSGRPDARQRQRRRDDTALEC